MRQTAGFDAGFREVFEREYDRLARHLARVCGRDERAADLAQESFVRLYRRGTMPEDPAAWLVSVAYNLMRDAHRTAARRSRLLEKWREDVLRPGSPASPEEQAHAGEVRARVRRALDGLPERDRRALLLRHEGYSYREIARALNYAPSGIGKLLVRASRAFRRALEEVDHHAPE